MPYEYENQKLPKSDGYKDVDITKRLTKQSYKRYTSEELQLAIELYLNGTPMKDIRQQYPNVPERTIYNRVSLFKQSSSTLGERMSQRPEVLNLPPSIRDEGYDCDVDTRTKRNTLQWNGSTTEEAQSSSTNSSTDEGKKSERRSKQYCLNITSMPQAESVYSKSVPALFEFIRATTNTTNSVNSASSEHKNLRHETSNYQRNHNSIGAKNHYPHTQSYKPSLSNRSSSMEYTRNGATSSYSTKQFQYNAQEHLVRWRAVNKRKYSASKTMQKNMKIGRRDMKIMNEARTAGIKEIGKQKVQDRSHTFFTSTGGSETSRTRHGHSNYTTSISTEHTLNSSTSSHNPMSTASTAYGLKTQSVNLNTPNPCMLALDMEKEREFLEMEKLRCDVAIQRIQVCVQRGLGRQMLIEAGLTPKDADELLSNRVHY